MSQPLFHRGALTHQGEIVLTAGSDLDRTAWNAWPEIIPTEEYFAGDIVPNNLRNPDYLTTRLGNYGQQGGKPNWYFRNRPDYDYEEGHQAGMPGPIREPYRLTWQNLPAGTYWQRYVDRGQWDNQDSLGSPSNEGNPLAFTPAGNASLKESIL